jgi:integrase
MAPDGHRHAAPATFDTRKDAEGWLAAVQTDISRDEWHRPTLRSPMQDFGTYSASWLETRDLRPLTRAEYSKLLAGHLTPTFGEVRLDDITPVMVRDWYAGLVTGPTRKAHAYGLLRAILNTAVADDAIPSNPCRVRGAGQTKRARAIRPATLPELGVITEAMPDQYRAAVLIAAWCGLRFGEIAELRRRDIDLDGGLVRVRRAVTHVDGQPVVGVPKSHAGVRDVAIPPHLIEPLADHLRRHVPRGRDALLFTAPGGGQLRGDGVLHEAFHAARAAAGRPDLRFHDLRHTGATLAAATGATLAELMRRIGHSTPHAAMRYQHATDDRDQAIADALSGFATAKIVELRPRRSAESS